MALGGGKKGSEELKRFTKKAGDSGFRREKYNSMTSEKGERNLLAPRGVPFLLSKKGKEKNSF